MEVEFFKAKFMKAFVCVGMLSNISLLCLRLAPVRSLSTTTVLTRILRFTPKENSGVYRRLKAIKEDEADVFEKSEINFEDLEALEEDFMQAEGIHDDITSKMQSIRKAQEYSITERRHFKPPKEPNMLTWSEKEQIKYLHQSEPDKWTVLSLAQSFPASPRIIKKILKLRWIPLSAEKLIIHDRKVSDNWVAFHRGQLEVHDLRLKAHLAKFVDRKGGVQTATNEEAIKATEIILPKPKRTEFLSLVTSFSPNNKENKIELKKLEENCQPFKKIEDSRGTDLKERYSTSQKRTSLNREVDTSEQPNKFSNATIGTIKLNNLENNSLPYIAPSERFKTNAVAFQRSEKANLELQDPDNLPNKITIPREKWIRGRLYRVNDSFYSDDGNFLYRVPGLKF